ncbi:MAG: competence/damage-inducible protein A [Planctomycetes bacterium]|nr:competence/damage-inducible protein A [Planctomycetota bacterium]
MSAEAIIITIGNELTSGLIADTNSAEMSLMLAELGIVTIRHETVDDHVERIAAALRRAAGEAAVVLVAGGLGPTEDDVTREALALVLGRSLELHAESLRQIEALFAARGYVMSPANRRQALCPAGAEPLANPVGTAPGIAASVGGARVFVVPGVPREMRHLMGLHVLPRLADAAGGEAVVYRTAHAFGAGESVIGEKLADLMGRSSNPLVGTTACDGIIAVRITARGADRAGAAALAERTLEEVRRRLGPIVFGIDDQTLAGAVVEALGARRQTMAVAESCTGGWLGKLLVDVPGASGVLAGGVISYANAVKEALLGVEPDLLAACGAVSEPVAAAMAQGVRRRLGVDYALAITGVAGPAGGTAAKPVGLVYTALAWAEGQTVRRHQFPGDRQGIRLRAALTALNMLRLHLMES